MAAGQTFAEQLTHICIDFKEAPKLKLVLSNLYVCVNANQ